jgi:hypothetical protein
VGRRWLLINRGRKRSGRFLQGAYLKLKGLFLFRPPAPLSSAAETAKGRSSRADCRPPLPCSHRRPTANATARSGEVRPQCTQLLLLASVAVTSPRRKISASRQYVQLATTSTVSSPSPVARYCTVATGGKRPNALLCFAVQRASEVRVCSLPMQT